MKIPYIPIYAYTLIDNKIVINTWTAMYIGDNKYRVFYRKHKQGCRNYYDIDQLRLEELHYNTGNLHITLTSFNNNDELEFINQSLSLLESCLVRENDYLNEIKECIATEHYYCNWQTTRGLEIATSEKIKEISNKIELFNKLKGQYNEHN